MGTLADYPPPSRALTGEEVLAAYQDGHQIAVELATIITRILATVSPEVASQLTLQIAPLVAAAALSVEEAGVARDAAVAAGVEAVSTLSAAIGGGAVIEGGPEVAYAIAANPLSQKVWVHPEPVPRPGILRAFKATVKRAGAIRLGFVDRAGNVMLSRIVTFTGTGEQTVAVPPGAIEAGWREAVISNGAVDEALLGYMAFGTALRGSEIAADAAFVPDLAVYFGATIALAYDADASDGAVAQKDATNNRVSVFSSTLETYPDEWVEVSTSPFTFGPNGMVSPETGQGWGCFMQTNWWTRLERRLTRIILTDMTVATIFAPAWNAPGQGPPVFEGNGRGPSMVAVDWTNRTLAIKVQPNGNGDPGNVYSVPLVAGHVAANPQLMEWDWSVRDQTLTLTDMYSGAVTTLGNPRTGDATDTNLPGGNMNDALAFVAVAGRATVRRVDVLYGRPRPKVLALGDSITQGDQQLAGSVWSRMLDGQLGGEVAISAMGGGRTRTTQATWRSWRSFTLTSPSSSTE